MEFERRRRDQRIALGVPGARFACGGVVVKASVSEAGTVGKHPVEKSPVGGDTNAWALLLFSICSHDPEIGTASLTRLSRLVSPLRNPTLPQRLKPQSRAAYRSTLFVLEIPVFLILDSHCRASR